MIDQDIDLLSLLDRAFVRFSSRPALRREGGAGAPIELSYGELRSRIARAAASLRERGAAPGARIALLSENRPEWVISFLAALAAGCTVVPLDPKLGVDELVVLLGHAQPRLVLCSQAQRERALDAASRALVGRVVVIDDEAAQLHGATELAADPRRDDEVAVIIYTSGTTGAPKGVAITLGNLRHQVGAVDTAIGPQGRERFLSLLPLCHLYELICGLLVPLSRGATISYPGTDSILPADITRLMKARRVTSLVGVPLLYRALWRGIESELRRAPRAARLIVAIAGAIAIRVPFAAVRRALFWPVLRAFGGHLHQLYSGGAPLDDDVARAFEKMGLFIQQGYGLSETSPVIATNTPSGYRRGSVGRPLPGVRVRIVDGEIQTRGANVMQGYVDRPDLTAEVMTADGWLRTGDLGRIDADGFVYVTGRAKDVIVLGGGKKVYPDEVEQVLARSPGFAEVCVLGVRARAGHEEVCAVVVPAVRDAADAIAAATDVVAEAAEDEVARSLAGVAAFKRPTRVLVRHEPIPRTTTRKAKRAALAAWISHLEQAA